MVFNMPSQAHYSRVLPVLLLIMLGSIGAPMAGAQATAPATRPAGPERWEQAIAAFETLDRASAPPQEAILFIGSSSIRGWRLEKHFPDLPVINRGFGGSQIEDSVHFAHRIVLPYRPRTIVFYAGENDIAAGKTPEQVAGDFERFTSIVRSELPDTRIVFLGLKPSPSRWKLIEQFRQTNALIRQFVQAQERMRFVDVEPAMLDERGRPREELFLKDMLHMTPAGYEVWTGLVRPHLH
jgi:lysophospholipase L1-like esterase